MIFLPLYSRYFGQDRVLREVRGFAHSTIGCATNRRARDYFFTDCVRRPVRLVHAALLLPRPDSYAGVSRYCRYLNKQLDGKTVDVAKILNELRAERAQIKEAILSLERLAQGRGKRRGRPPAWMSQIVPKRRGRPPGSKNRPATTAANH